MMERRRGHIIVMTSIAAREVYPLGVIYCATKHALSAITRGLRVELQGYGIKVTEIAPGMVDTDIRATSDHPRVLEAHEGPEIRPLTPRRWRRRSSTRRGRAQLLPGFHRAAAARRRLANEHGGQPWPRRKGEDNGEAAGAREEDESQEDPAVGSRAKPKAKAQPKQMFNVNHLARRISGDGLRTYAQYRDLGMSKATNGLLQAHVIRLVPPRPGGGVEAALPRRAMSR